MKYYISLCCIIKDERYLEEFILHHRIIGVEHFYIYDNDSTPPISDRLSNFYYSKLCTIIRYPGSVVQMNAYHDCLNNFGSETNWLIVCDGDEYILPKKHFSLRDFLNEYEHAQAIGINWVFFGTSFHEYKQDGFLTDKYRYCSKTQDKHIKTICKPIYTIKFDNPHSVTVRDPSKYIDCHNNIISGPWNYNINNDIIQINHYFGRSIEENIEKHYRGHPDSTTNRYNPPQDLNSHNNDVICNILVDKYLNHIIKENKITGVNWQIYRALNTDLQHITDMNQIYEHVFNNANVENRYLHINDKYPHFNRNIYRKNYSCFNHLDDLTLELHYIYNGHSANDICHVILPKFQDLSEYNNIKIIIARCDEDINWSLEFKNILIYNKGNKINIDNELLTENVGRECHTYYKYIYDNYDNLNDYIIFLQGNPFDHSPNIINNLWNYIINKDLNIDFEYLSEKILTCNLSGCIHKPGLLLCDMYKNLFNEDKNNMEFQFGQGGQFIVSKKIILSKPKEFYLKIIKLLDYSINPIEGHIIERFHKLIFLNNIN